MPRLSAWRPGSRNLDASTDGRHRAGPGGTSTGSPRSGRKRWTAGVGATAVVIGTLGVLTPQASAAINTFGPVDPASNFPAYYTDGNGLSLAMCEDGGTLCLSGPQKIQDVHATPGADAEAFYYVADAATDTFVLHNALEAAYAGDGANQEVVFMRTQVTARDGGLVAGATYNVTDPYGTFTCVAEAGGVLSQNACRVETEPVAGEFNRALNGRIGPFLTRDPAAPAPRPGYLGAIDDYTKVVGSPTGFNAFRVEGPGLTGTCTDTDGSTIQNCEQTDQFFLLGKIADTGVPAASVSQGTLDFGDVPATPAVTKTLTYANIGALPVTIGSIALGGTNASAFGQTNDCPVAPATLDTGARCTISVTYTPESGKASAATLTITDNTPAATRNIALKGSNLGVLTVADPGKSATGAQLGLGFPDTPVNRPSPEDNVVIGNTGNGPLSIASATITGASAGHFKLGPNNTCTTPVAPDSGCEIGVVFQPTSTGGKSANLRVTDSNGTIANIPLTGRGITAAPVAPSAPTNVSATGGQASATVTWTPPADTGGAAITGYSVRVWNGTTQVGTPRTAAATATNLTVTGLTGGTAYTFDVAATNSVGTGSYSTRSGSVTPTAAPTAPGAPAAPTATAGDAQATVTWAAPANTGGSAITSYDVQVRTGTTVVRTVTGVAATPTSTVVTGLTNGTAYNFRVRAVNAVGPGGYSAASANVTPRAGTTTTPPATGDTTAPTVSTRTPAQNATAVGVAFSPTVTFSEAVQGVGTSTFAIRPAADPTATPIAGTVTQNGTTNQWILNPTANLANDTRYTVTLTGGTTAIRDAAGNALAGTTAQPLSWSFTTGPAPTVSTRTPAANATAVSRTANVTATFSETVEAVSGTTFTLRNPAGTVITAVVSYNATTRVATLNPSVTLAANTVYRVSLVGGASGIRDVAGNPLANTNWSFTTGA